MPRRELATAWSITRWIEEPHPDASIAEIEAIFFAAAARDYPTEPERGEFRERWLGRYLTHDAPHAFVARDSAGKVAGFLVGSLDDPARTDRFADILYFAPWAHLTARFPAHLHINLAAAARNHGVGRRLVEAFATHAQSHGAPGVHVVTAAAARNVRFYTRAGFAPHDTRDHNGTAIVFLARALT